jgi:methanogenic corrinoid protein MtbC1
MIVSGEFMSSTDGALESLAEAILAGKGEDAIAAAHKALEAGVVIEEIAKRGVLKAWYDFCTWYEKDEKTAIMAWTDCFLITRTILKLLESKIEVPKDPPFSVLVATVLGEGHVTMREILATMLKAKGIKVYTSSKGVRVGDVSEALSDPKLRFIVLSCIEISLAAKVQEFVKGVKEKRKDVMVIAGGPMAEKSGADLVTSDLEKFNSIVAPSGNRQPL